MWITNAEHAGVFMVMANIDFDKVHVHVDLTPNGGLSRDIWTPHADPED